MKKFYLLIALIILSCSKPNDKPNLLFILVDDLGWTDVSYNGSDFYETYNIDRLSLTSTISTGLCMRSLLPPLSVCLANVDTTAPRFALSPLSLSFVPREVYRAFVAFCRLSSSSSKHRSRGTVPSIYLPASIFRGPRVRRC